MAVFDVGAIKFEAVPVPYDKVVAGESYLRVTVGGGGPTVSTGYMEVVWGVTDSSDKFAFEEKPNGGFVVPHYDSYWLGRIKLESLNTLMHGWEHQVHKNAAQSVILKNPIASVTTIYKVTSVNGVRV